MQPERELTKAEEQIMQVLWQIEKGFVKDVLDELPEPKPADRSARSRNPVDNIPPRSLSSRRSPHSPTRLSMPPPPSSPGRNDSCPCGSGLKYKKCHLGTDENATLGARS